MFREGELTVRLGVQANRIRSVDIASTRTPLPARLTQGHTVEDVERTIPLLFSICARAQGAAASAALVAAQGLTTDAGQFARRSDDVRREAIVELLTRLLIDWPKVLGASADVPAVARVRQAPLGSQLDVCREISRERVFGVDASRWLAAMTTEVLGRWITEGASLPARLLQQLQTDVPDLGRSEIEKMPNAGVEGVNRILPAPGADTGFSRTPHWLGKPVETGSLARQAHHPLLAAFATQYGNTVSARFLAQLVELATWLAPGETPTGVVQQYTVAEGIGLGLAETARGLLLHQAQVSEGRVEHYRIVAPTEWNFHPGGALTQGLVGRPVRNAADARGRAALLVQALDPCVACTIEVADA
jgi:hypothetical protein